MSLQGRPQADPRETPELDLLADFLPIPLDSIRAGGIVGFDIYIRVNGKFVLYRNGTLPFSIEVRDKLLNLNAKTLFIKTVHIDSYLEHLEAHLDEVISRQHIPVEEKAETVYSAVSNSMSAFLASPHSKRCLSRVRKLAETLVHFLTQEESYFHLVKKMSSDFSERTHACHVAIHSVALVGMLGTASRLYLDELALGALLHDVGKTKAAINLYAPDGGGEEGTLRQHPLWGVKLMAEVDAIPPTTALAILTHQERCDGSGYPYGLRGPKIPECGRIVAIADVFDALTTRMPYREAMVAYEALRLMREEMSGQFDESIIVRFIMLLAGREQPVYRL